MKAIVVAHRPLTLPGPKMTQIELDVEHTDRVNEFKDRVAKETGLDAANLTVIYNSKVRGSTDQISENELKGSSPSGRCFIHIRIEDPVLNAQVEERLKNGPSMFIPLKDVKVKQAK